MEVLQTNIKLFKDSYLYALGSEDSEGIVITSYAGDGNEFAYIGCTLTCRKHRYVSNKMIVVNIDNDTMFLTKDSQILFTNTNGKVIDLKTKRILRYPMDVFNKMLNNLSSRTTIRIGNI
jgi:hypothetical protein